MLPFASCDSQTYRQCDLPYDRSISCTWIILGIELRVLKDSGLFSKLSLREKALVTLLAVGAFAEDMFTDGFGLQRSDLNASLSGYSYEDIKYFQERRKTFKYTLLRLLKKKWIENKGTNLQDCRYNLTPDGINYIFSKFPAIKYRKQPWDGYWRMVFYDIKESEKRLRSRLRTFLKHIGFMYIQKSVWITAFPVDEELEKFFRKEGQWGKIIVCKSILSPLDSRRLFPLFYQQIGGIKCTQTEKELIAMIDPLFRKELVT